MTVTDSAVQQSRMVTAERGYHRLVWKETRAFGRILLFGAVVCLTLFSLVVATGLALRGDISQFRWQTLWVALRDFSTPSSLNGQLILALVVGGLSFLGISFRATAGKDDGGGYAHKDLPDCTACSRLEDAREKYLSQDFQVGFAVGMSAVFWLIILVIVGTVGWGDTQNLVEVITLIFLAFFVLIVVFQFARLSESHPSVYVGAAFDALSEFNARKSLIEGWVQAESAPAFRSAVSALRLRSLASYAGLIILWGAVFTTGFVALPHEYEFTSVYGAVLLALFGGRVLGITYTRVKAGKPAQLTKHTLTLVMFAAAVIISGVQLALSLTHAQTRWIPWLGASWLAAVAVSWLVVRGLFSSGPCRYLSVEAALSFAQPARSAGCGEAFQLPGSSHLRSLVGQIIVGGNVDEAPLLVEMSYWDELEPWRNHDNSSADVLLAAGHALPRLFTAGTPVTLKLKEGSSPWQASCYTLPGEDPCLSKVVVVLPGESTPPVNTLRAPSLT